MLLISEKANIYGEDMVSYCLIITIIYIILIVWAITCFNGYCYEEYNSGQVFNVQWSSERNNWQGSVITIIIVVICRNTLIYVSG